MDGIRKIGPRDHPLESKHTMPHYRTGFYRPWISSTENFDRWQRNGSRTADRVANEKWKQLLNDYADPGIDSGWEDSLRAFIRVGRTPCWQPRSERLPGPGRGGNNRRR